MWTVKAKEVLRDRQQTPQPNYDLRQGTEPPLVFPSMKEKYTVGPRRAFGSINELANNAHRAQCQGSGND